MLRYAITDRKLFHGNELDRQDALVCAAAAWARSGINFVQIREKDLSAGELAVLTQRVLAAVRAEARAEGEATRVLVNSRADVAVATGADGVHLTGSPDELTVAQVRSLYARAGLPEPVVSLSCHALDEVRRVAGLRPDAILFGPVFEKAVQGAVVASGGGLELLRAACEAAAPVRVFALGGVSLQLASECLASGAAGVAGIRLFQVD